MVTKQLIRAELIGELSAGTTAIRILDDNEVYYFHRWFDDGASSARYYNDALREAYDCMTDFAELESYEGNMIDQYVGLEAEGYVAISYDGESWAIVDAQPGIDGQTLDWVRANKDRLPDHIVALLEEE